MWNCRLRVLLIQGGVMFCDNFKKLCMDLKPNWKVYTVSQYLTPFLLLLPSSVCLNIPSDTQYISSYVLRSKECRDLGFFNEFNPLLKMRSAGKPHWLIVDKGLPAVEFNLQLAELRQHCWLIHVRSILLVTLSFKNVSNH